MFREKLIDAKLFSKFPAFYTEFQDLLPCSQNLSEDPFLSHLNLDHILTPYFISIQFSIILLCMHLSHT